MEELKSFTVSGVLTAPKPTASGTASVLPPSAPDPQDPDEIAGYTDYIWELFCQLLGVDPGSAQEVLGRLIDLISLWRQAETADAVA
jgi:hypothetical protein